MTRTPQLAALRSFAMLALALTLFALSACLQSSPAAASRDSAALKVWFPDPQAQALAVAAERGDAAQVRRLMKDEDINPDKFFGVGQAQGMPLLVWPIYMQSPGGLKAMLENGADPNAAVPHPMQHTSRFKGRNRNNAMVWAARSEDTVYLDLLLDHGGNPDTRNSNGETLMLQAFFLGQWDNVQLLVKRGADVNAKSQGEPIITTYASRGGFEAVYWLLQQGADPDNDSDQPRLKRTINAIFWHPGNPKDPTWQRKCQQWLLQRGYTRPPMPKSYRDMRKNFGFPYEEKDIPLL
jgi:uncharacterized protein